MKFSIIALGCLVTKASSFSSQVWSIQSSNRPNFRTNPLCSSRRSPPPSERSYYNDYDDEEEDGGGGYADDYNYYEPELSKKNQRSKGREVPRRVSQDEDDFYDDEIVSKKSIDRTLPSKRKQPDRVESRRGDGYYRDDYIDDDGNGDGDDDEYYDDDVSTPGNFWSNTSADSKPRMSRGNRDDDYEAPRPRRPRGYRATPDDRRRPRKRSSIRPRSPPVPKPAKNFYEQLFWYGFDADENDEVGDKTVFGGTKGKFNGLAYLTASDDRPARYGRQLPPSRRRYEDEEDDYYYEEDENYVEARDTDNYAQPLQSSVGAVKPPNDIPIPRSEQVNKRDRRASRRQRRRDPYDDRNYDSDEDSRNGNDWVSKQVSSWFSLDGDDDEPYDEYDNRSRRRQERRQGSEWTPFSVLDTFFGLDREDMAYKAEMYNEKMGIGKARGSRNRSRVQAPDTGRSRRRRRQGYAYRYDPEEDDEMQAFDVDAASEYPNETSSPTNGENSDQKSSASDDVDSTPRKREQTWEERSLAVERVPPADIPAWGPSGELPMDARTKGILDALEDTQIAQQKLGSREKKEAMARENITVLKVDAEVEKRRMRQAAKGARLSQERLRQIQLDIDDAALSLRRARTQVKMARDQVEILKERHWALLSFYNPDQAKERVAEALDEFQLLEPAARLEEMPAVDEMPKAQEGVESVMATKAEVPVKDNSMPQSLEVNVDKSE